MVTFSQPLDGGKFPCRYGDGRKLGETVSAAVLGAKFQGQSSKAKERQDCIGSNSRGPLVEAWRCRRAGGAGGLPGGGEMS